jgi:hypothetical protein
MHKVLTTGTKTRLDYSWPNYIHDPCLTEFSFRQIEKKALTRGHVLLSWWSYDKPGIALSGHQTVEYESTGSHVILIRESQVTYFQAIKMPNSNATKWRYLWFEALMTDQKSHFQLVIMPKSAWYEASSPGVKDFTTRQESHFQTAKLKKSWSTEVLQPRISWPLNDLIFNSPKCRTEALWILDSYW